MAQQQHQDTAKIGFKSIQLLKDQTLGIGSYGSVCKALCDDLLCAAKIIHPTLFDPNVHQQIDRRREHRLPIQRFMQECEFMSAIRHPNIVQFLGTHQDPQTGLPVLLMELMDDSLTQFLESSQGVLPYHIQVNFCHDITLAIFYLHLNGITHRDLSSNNVLLCGTVKAKVTDFGMAKLGDINPQATGVSFTMCPGTDVYMPPEAVKDPPVYTEKIDCFSIGTLIIQILTRCFPTPGDRLKTIQIDHPQFPGGTVDVRTSEIERRQNHISQVDPNHPLLPIALDCLKDSDVERPSAQELCHRVAALKETPQFTERVRRAQERPKLATTEREEKLRQQVQVKDNIIKQKDYIIQCKNDIIQEKNDIIQNKVAHVQQKDEEIHQMRQEHTQQIQGLQEIIGSQNNRLQLKDCIIQSKDQTIVASQQECQQLRETIRDQQKQLAQVTQQLESSHQVMAQFQTRIQELEQRKKKRTSTNVLANPQQSLRDPPQTHHSDTSARTATATRNSFTLRWRAGKKAPCEMVRVPNAVVDGEMVYLRADTQTVYAYNSRNETWEQLPDCPYSGSSLVVIRSCPTAVGGGNIGLLIDKFTNKLFSLTGEGSSKKWSKVYPPMPTKRSKSTAVVTGQALIVAGGVSQDGYTLRTMEIMNTDTKQWSPAAEFPVPLRSASVTIFRECVYIGGGSNYSGPSKSVYTCTLADLFRSCWTRSLQQLAQSLTLTSPPRSTVWSKVADLPVTGFTCVTLQGRLLAIGGRDSWGTPTSDVSIYHPTSDTWEVISKMNTSRQLCFATVLPTNEVMVVGGYTTSSDNSTTPSVEIGTVESVSS